MRFRKGQLLHVRRLSSPIPSAFTTIWRITSIRQGVLYVKALGSKHRPEALMVSVAREWLRQDVLMIGGRS